MRKNKTWLSKLQNVRLKYVGKNRQQKFERSVGNSIETCAKEVAAWIVLCAPARPNRRGQSIWLGTIRWLRRTSAAARWSASYAGVGRPAKRISMSWPARDCRFCRGSTFYRSAREHPAALLEIVARDRDAQFAARPYSGCIVVLDRWLGNLRAESGAGVLERAPQMLFATAKPLVLATPSLPLGSSWPALLHQQVDRDAAPVDRTFHAWLCR